MATVDDPIEILRGLVTDLYHYRDHYFENHDIADASRKPQELQLRLETTMKEFDKLEAASVNQDRSSFLYLKGRLLHVNGEFNSEAEFCLSKSVKLNPNLVEAWNELGEAYMRKHDWTTARTCFESALQYEKNKVSLRNLSMTLRQIPVSSSEEKITNVEQGLLKGKEAVGLDTGDGQSWSLLGNAYLSHFFQVSQNPKTLKQAMSAYNQAEKDVVAKSSPELHYNRGIAQKYEEEFHSALSSFSSASALDPTWSEPRNQSAQMIKYLKDIVGLIQLKGKLKPKKLSSMITSLDPNKQLGPYSGGQYNSPNGGSVSLKPVMISDLVDGSNSEKVILGVVICSIHSEELVPFTFIMTDSHGDCVVVTLYNLSPGKGVIIGDTIAIPEPYFTKIDINWEDSEYKFNLVRVESPLVLVINSRKAGRDLQAGVQMLTFTKTN